MKYDFDTIFWIFCAAMLIFMAGIGVGATLEASIRAAEETTQWKTTKWYKAD